MKVLFDVTHPAHVHLFKHAIGELDERGHSVHVTSREKELTTYLLDAYGIPHDPLSAKGDSVLSLAAEWGVRELRMVRKARSLDPDVVVSRLNPTATHAARAAGCPSIVFDDTEWADLPGKLAHPFADVICTPANFGRDVGPAQLRYDGYHELAYLHPNWFTPNERRLREQGVDIDEPYSVVRFVSWDAHHDVGHEGLSLEAKRNLVSALDDYGEVYITSEDPLPEEFEPYRLPVDPADIHDLLAHADLYVGDSGTMATEAAVLGTPAVRSSDHAASETQGNFIELQETYELLYSTSDDGDVVRTARDLLSDPETPARWRERREDLLSDKIDVTEFMLDLITAEGAAASGRAEVTEAAEEFPS